MADFRIHPRLIEGIERQAENVSSARRLHCRAAIDYVDRALESLRTVQREQDALLLSISFGPFVAVFIREYEELRSYFRALDPKRRLTAEEVDGLLRRIRLAHDLLDCFSSSLNKALSREASEKPDHPAAENDTVPS